MTTDTGNKEYWAKWKTPHTHSFTYAASGATITATCGAEDCDLKDSKTTLTIVAPTMTVYGQTGDGISASATLTGLEDFNTATGKSLAVTNIKYVGRDGTEYTESTTAPTNAGKYTATITLSGVKTTEGENKSVAASVDYSIKYSVTFNTNGGSAVPQQLVEAGESATRPTDPTREGNIFGGWFADADFAKRYVFDEVTENTTVYAKWGEHRVTWTVGKFSIQDVFTGNAPAADSNTTVNLAAETLKPDGATLSWKTETDVSGDVTHTAQFSFPVTLNVNGGTINAGNVESYIYGTGATLPTDVTRAKYDFGGWYANSELTGTAVTQIGTTATGSKEFWAKWTAVYAVPAAVTANNRTYDGTDKPLVTVTGEPTGGTMWYAVGTQTEAPEWADGADPNEKWKTSIPTGTNAGTYYVWYKVVGDANHSDTEPTSVIATIAPVEPTITGADLVLNGSLDFRFYVALPVGFNDSSAYMRFTVHGRTVDVPISQAGTAADGKRIFSCPVYSIEMAEDVKAEFHYKSGTATLTTSIDKYLNKLSEQSGNPDKLTNLINATRDYGHYIQPYLSRLHNFKIGAGGYAVMPAASSSITPVTADALANFKTNWNSYSNTVLDSVSYYDTFAESTTLHVLVKLKSAKNNVTATVDDEGSTVTSLGNNTYGIEIPSIAANNLGVKYRVVFSESGTTICDIDVSALTYVRAVLASRSVTDEAEALTAFYNYFKAADAYGQN